MLSIPVLALLADFLQVLRFSSREEPRVSEPELRRGSRKISGGFLEAFAVDCGCSIGLDSFFAERLLQRYRPDTHSVHRFNFSGQHHGRQRRLYTLYQWNGTRNRYGRIFGRHFSSQHVQQNYGPSRSVHYRGGCSSSGCVGSGDRRKPIAWRRVQRAHVYSQSRS